MLISVCRVGASSSPYTMAVYCYYDYCLLKVSIDIVSVSFLVRLLLLANGNAQNTYYYVNKFLSLRNRVVVEGERTSYIVLLIPLNLCFFNY